MPASSPRTSPSSSAASASGWWTARRCSRPPVGRCSDRWRSTSTLPTRATCTCSTRSPSASQRERYLAPLARGEQRSAFAMTEPPPGAGSDPTRAADRGPARRRRVVVITGRKKFITGADGAGFYIVMARTSGSPTASAPAARRCSSCRPTGPGSGSCATCARWTARCSAGTARSSCDDVRVPVRGRARRGRRGVPLRAGPARPGPADARDALARRGAASPRDGGRRT